MGLGAILKYYWPEDYRRKEITVRGFLNWTHHTLPFNWACQLGGGSTAHVARLNLAFHPVSSRWTSQTCHKVEMCVCVCLCPACGMRGRGGLFSAACTGWWMSLQAWFALWNLPSRSPECTGQEPVLPHSALYVCQQHSQIQPRVCCHIAAEFWHFGRELQSAAASVCFSLSVSLHLEMNK